MKPSIGRRFGAIGLAAASALSVCAMVGATDEQRREVPYFVIGAWQQPSENGASLAGSGVNTLVSLPRGAVLSEWNESAQALGLKVIVEPSAAEMSNLDESNVAAWLFSDEPDLHNVPASTIEQELDLMIATNSQLPRMVNFSGAVISGVQESVTGGTPPDSSYTGWSDNADIVSHSLYPVAGWSRSEWIDATNGNTLNSEVQERISRFAPNKRMLAFIEVCDQNLPWTPDSPSPTPDQTRGQIWDAILNGASGIVYFTVALEPFVWDNTSAEMRSEMASANGLIEELEPFLLGSRTQLSLQLPFKRVEFSAIGHGSVQITLNMSPRQMSLDGQAYDPYEVRVRRE